MVAYSRLLIFWFPPEKSSGTRQIWSSAERPRQITRVLPARAIRSPDATACFCATGVPRRSWQDPAGRRVKQMDLARLRQQETAVRPTFGFSDGSTRAMAGVAAISKWIRVSEPSGSTSLICTAIPEAPAGTTSKCSGRTPTTPLPAADFSRARSAASRGAACAVRKHRDIATQFDREEIHRRRADEAGDELVRRPLVDRLGRVVLLHDAALQDHDPVGHRHGLDLVVGDEDHRRLQLLRQRLDLRPHLRRAISHRGWTSGSSNRNTCGLRTMARPMATRWRWPPESSFGLRSR